jgi:dephospho-CoA kinase
VLNVGLTGGIGSGKSSVSRLLAELGAVIIDADRAAREVVEPGTSGLAAVVEAFGPGVLRPDGSLDRERLGEIVFADPARRAELNAIVHPLVGERMARLAGAAPDDAVVVYDVPLLAENDRAGQYDTVIVVDVPEEVQVRRLVADRGMTADAARSRIAAQIDRERRLAVADIVIDNSGTRTDLEAAVRKVWEELRACR